MLKDKIKSIIGKKCYNQSKDETSNGGSSGSGQSFWDRLLQALLPRGGGR